MSNPRFIYTGDQLKHISFPLGGIGTGSIGFSGAGRLVDWEIFNRPAKGIGNGFSHFAIKAERQGDVLDARVLNGPFTGDLTGDYRAEWARGFGAGARRDSLAGVPHFGHAEFEGRFPVSALMLSDPAFPGVVRIEAFNPLIPLNERDSSLPAAMFAITVTNTSDAPIDYSIAGVLGHGPVQPTAAKPFGQDGINGVSVTTPREADGSPRRTELVIATDAAETSRQTYLFRGLWFDALQVYWNDFTAPGRFRDRTSVPDYDAGGMPRDRDHSLQAAHITVPAGESRTVRFVIAWYVPNFEKYWVSQYWHFTEPPAPGATWPNWYATEWPGAEAVAIEALQRWDELTGMTERFRDAIYGSTLPAASLDAAVANLSILKSPTVARLTDGSLYGWEGLWPDVGSCEGSCTHVWNYQQAVPFLFPALARSMRELDYTYNMDEAGGMSFRMPLPLGTDTRTESPCADGQFGNVMKLYWDWKMSGDDEWLARLWPRVKRSIEYAWSPENPDRWDRERTGVLWGRQHHTLDMELFGPNSWLTGFYLGALKAASEMGRHLGDNETAEDYSALFEKGRSWMREHLFNGEYFVQKVDLNDRSTLDPYIDGRKSRRLAGANIYDLYWSEEHGELKYQAGEACLIDQVLAQWHADLYGLGEIFDRDQVRSALDAIYAHNFKPDFGAVFNPCRVFSARGEAGTVISDYPEQARRPAVPVPYAQETMHGFEYSFGGALYQNGMIAQGAEVFAAVRDHYDGAKRNPWNEIECGSNYARSMASWGAVPTLSGFSFDARDKSMGFAPLVRHGDRFRSFWSCGSAWGTVELTEGALTIAVADGSLTLARLRVPDGCETVRLHTGETLEHDKHTDGIGFAPVTLVSGGSLTLLGSALSPAALRDVATLQ
ncbi:hypothetical protein EMQ25_05370 [Arsenicitalea aurantiaca]|uniref:Beta-glucosidase n=1 Tax=Arsenicitalea aurantiaca TaxID=1783274 RepID=A0A433XER1_9HYPH|nr:GH116 family glycosyl-hydrolase [Arsenicitalea aurantiaca]RUT32585.1 hypothetical protein EMQ25_05370 [Arsenicitalea aurantiaca]